MGAPPSQDRICSSCSRPFQSKWRYARCLSCRYQESYKDQCACGARKDARSPCCRECSLGKLQIPGPLSVINAAWVAGLLEAEGTFPLRRKGGGTVRVQMADQDVIMRLYEVLGIGNLGTYVPRNPGHKQTWMLTIARREYVGWVLQQIAPIMSSRRFSAIARLAANYKEPLSIPPPVADIASLPDPRATAWLAGLIEGDGCIRMNEVAVATVDKDTAERAQAVAGCGQIYHVPRRRANWSEMYAWKVTSRQNVDHVLRAVQPWMLSRRSAAIRAILGGGDRSWTDIAPLRA
jgi:LAGLIDADG-like domain